MLNKPKLIALMMAAGLPLFAAGVNAYTVYYTVYKIDIEKSFIKASADDAVIELKLVSGSLVVDTLPAEGFYGLRLGDKINKVNGITIQSTNAFIAALEASSNDSAQFEVLRANQIIELPIPKKGYSWFL